MQSEADFVAHAAWTVADLGYSTDERRFDSVSEMSSGQCMLQGVRSLGVLGCGCSFDIHARC